jgi:DNA-binding SARP family transcriptional activator
MIELRTFGALDLRSSDGRDFRPILDQPKRLALLTYLAAAAQRGRFHRRDSLLALFWPERDAACARATLSRALYFLRSHLGEGVLLSRSDADVGLPAQTFCCDVTDFDEALKTDRFDDALALYRGEFLEGFHVSDAPEFERWVDSKRRELRDRAAYAARTLSQAANASGDVERAVHWAKRCVTLSPFDETDLRRVVGLLQRAGDRAGAVDFYRCFARRAKQELNVELSLESQSLLAGLLSTQ